MKKIAAALLGAGNRGAQAYGQYALRHQEQIEFVAVAEPDAERLAMFADQHNIAAELCFADWKELLARPRLADVLIISTQDRMHFEPAAAALKLGYHVLLEKPVSQDGAEIVKLGELAREHAGQVFGVAHVLRYTPFFSAVREAVASGRIGQVVSLLLNENVEHLHHAHSYVRGHWGVSGTSGPMILTKSCHDMDIILWLMGKRCTRVQSMGGLMHFRPEQAPAGAPARCTDGCPHENQCPYFAPRLYLGPYTGWPVFTISNDLSIEGRRRALEQGPYGRCVYRCGNDVVDHQVVGLEFEDGSTAAFSMCAFTEKEGRSLRIMGTKGEIRASVRSDEIEILDFLTGSVETVHPHSPEGGHGGGDEGLMSNFVQAVRGTAPCGTAVEHSVQPHLVALAAEKARVEGRVIDMAQYERELTAAGK